MTISELTKARPNAGALAWLEDCPDDEMFLSAVSLAEIAYGMEKRAGTAAHDVLRSWMIGLTDAFGERLLPIDVRVAITWGKLRREAQIGGVTPPILDGFLAATAIVHGLTLVTRNTRDFEAWNLTVLNPWSAE